MEAEAEPAGRLAYCTRETPMGSDNDDEPVSSANVVGTTPVKTSVSDSGGEKTAFASDAGSATEVLMRALAVTSVCGGSPTTRLDCIAAVSTFIALLTMVSRETGRLDPSSKTADRACVQRWDTSVLAASSAGFSSMT
jgi:hypothetical protein